MGALRRHAPAVLAHLAVLALWVWATSWGGVPRFILPGPLETLRALGAPQIDWPHHLAVTAAEAFGGFALAVVIGVVLAVVFTWSAALRRGLMPLLVTLNLVPKVALAPLFIVWLGYGLVPNIAITFVISFFPIVITTARGLAEVEPELIDLVRTVRATRWQVFRKIQLPSSLPYLFSGMRVAAVLAIAGTIVGEFVGSEAGLGFVIMSAQGTLDTPVMMMSLIMVTLVGVTLYGVVVLLERLVVTEDARLR
ncbi:MAG TPA: ABC transporter permease [Falsiroseomonas sp.]|jgi:NitT/TauT family transport system permease protein|nr:ABC transporter permease [Falsiroseomonas sp.]